MGGLVILKEERGLTVGGTERLVGNGVQRLVAEGVEYQRTVQPVEKLRGEGGFGSTGR